MSRDEICVFKNCFGMSKKVIVQNLDCLEAEVERPSDAKWWKATNVRLRNLDFELNTMELSTKAFERSEEKARVKTTSLKTSPSPLSAWQSPFIFQAQLFPNLPAQGWSPLLLFTHPVHTSGTFYHAVFLLFICLYHWTRLKTMGFLFAFVFL